MAGAASAVGAVGRTRESASSRDDPLRPRRGSPAALAGLADELLLLAPLGVLLPLATGGLERPLPRTGIRTVCSGALISSAIVLLQSGVPGQVVNVDSVLLHTFGAAVAFVLVFAPLCALLRRRSGAAARGRASARRGLPVSGLPGSHDSLRHREDVVPGAPPRPARVGIAPWSDAPGVTGQ